MQQKTDTYTVSIFVEELNILPENGSEREAAQTSSQCRGSLREEVILDAEGKSRNDSNEKQPKSIAITDVATISGVGLRETFYTLREHNSIGRVHHSTHW